MNKTIDFDLDDPLADFLSDKSDDSFFEDNKNKVSNVPSRNSSLDKKKSNLFGLEDKDSKEDKNIKENTSNSDWLGIKESPVENRKFVSNTNETQNVKQNLQASIKPKTLFSTDNLNILDDLGLSDAEPNVPVKNTDTAFMEDILGPPKTNTKSDTAVLPKNEQTSSTGYNPTSGSIKSSFVRLTTSTSKLDGDKIPQESKQKPLTTKSNTDLTKPRRREKIGKRQRSADWLGLFPDDEEIVEEKTKEKDVSLSELLRSEETVEKQSDRETIKNQDKNKSVTVEAKDSQNIINEQLLNTNLGMKNLLSGDNMILGNIPSMQMINNTEIEQQSTAICLQQQQSQLMVALQLKAQEESLAALHERHEQSRRVQNEVVSAHREQLEQLLKGQTEHRTQLHNIMMQHQQRINQHIQALLKPPPTWEDKQESKVKPPAEGIDLKINMKSDEDEGFEPKTISERQQLENMIVNLKENHSKELDILENSYRHQVHLIGESLTNVEDRLKSENENMTNYYLKRIAKLEQENVLLTEQADEKMKTLLEKLAIEREEIEKKHKRDIEILQEQNEAVINNIRETIALERSTLKDATEYSSKLDSILKDVEKNNLICSSYMDKINSRYTEDLQNRENALNTKEKQLAVLLENLESNKNAIERESQEIRINLRNWEERLHIQNKSIEEEKVALKFTKMEFENEKEILTREKEKFRVIIDSERDVMKRNIENIQEKYSEMEKELMDKMKKLEEDRMQLAFQKKSIEDTKKAHEEIQKKCESELNDIRENKKNIDITQQKLSQSETALAARFQELETLTRSALAKHTVAERKVSEANYVQEKYEEKMKEVQEFTLSLSAREQQVARDKVALSRERLTFYNMQKQYQCGLCKSSNNINSVIDLNKYTIPSLNTNKNFNPHYLEMAVTRDDTPTVDNGTTIKRNDIFKRSNIDSFNMKSHIQMDTNAVDNMQRNVDFMKQYEKPRAIFQEIVDPKLLLLKLDIQSSTKNQKTDLSDQEH